MYATLLVASFVTWRGDGCAADIRRTSVGRAALPSEIAKEALLGHSERPSRR